MVVESWILGGEPNVIGIHISALGMTSSSPSAKRLFSFSPPYYIITAQKRCHSEETLAAVR